MDIDTILQRLEKVKRVKSREDRWYALCPCHSDKSPSLCITRQDNKILMHCFTCKANGINVCYELGIDARELFENS